MSAGSSPVYLPVPRWLLLAAVALAALMVIALVVALVGQLAGHGPSPEPLLTAPIRWLGTSGQT